MRSHSSFRGARRSESRSNGRRDRAVRARRAPGRKAAAMILIKEEFVGGEKWRRAVELGGSDVIALWVAMKCYCSIHPDTEGFIPDEDLDGLPGAPRGARRKALQALIGCGRLLPGGERGPGLVEGAEGGWQMHDYGDHSAPPEEIELRKEKQRLKKQAYRETKRRELDALRGLTESGDTWGQSRGQPGGQSRGQPGDSPGDSQGTVPGDDPARACPPESARAPAPARVGAHPNPTQPNPQKNLRRLASGIRGARARPGERGHPVEASAAHRQFAAEHGLELEPFLEQLRDAPSTAGLTEGEIGQRLAAMLVQAAERQREAVGGAA